MTPGQIPTAPGRTPAPEVRQRPLPEMGFESWDRYDVKALIGRGGMGQVFRARDRTLNRPVALKFLHDADADLSQRLLDEAQAQARVDHPDICKVYEVGEHGGRAYIAMQLIDGRPISAAKEMSRDEQVATMRRVAEAVHAAHRSGLIHRDLKPSNILVARDPDGGGWKPYLMDFGIARRADARQTLIRATLADLLILAGEFDRAIAIAGEVIAQADDWYYGSYALGTALARAGRDREALAALAHAVELDPECADCHVEVAAIHLAAAGAALSRGRDPRQSVDAARITLEALLAANPGDARGHAGLAEADLLIARWLIGRGRAAGVERQDGLAHVARALEIHPDMPAAVAVRDALGTLGGRP